MKKLLFLLLLAFGFTGAYAAEDALLTAHTSKGIQCAACHQEVPPAKRVKTAKCQSCHGSYEQLAERTKNMQPNNVHANHLGDLECKACHGVHKQQKLECDECHQFKFSMPAS